MRAIFWVVATIIFVCTGLNSYGIDFYAQRSPVIPTSINGDISEPEVSGEESSVCVDNLTNSSSNSCEPTSSVEIKDESDTQASTEDAPESNENDEHLSLLPDPEVDFVDDYVVKFDSNKSRDTIFYGGLVPFVALPDAELVTKDSFFNEESFSIFFYLKRKF